MSFSCSYRRKLISKAGILLLLTGIIIIYPTVADATYDVKPNNYWKFNVLKAQRYFEYSLGVFKGKYSAAGYQLGETKVPLGDYFNITVISIESNSKENVSFKIISTNESLITTSSSRSFLQSIQESLGQSLLGEGVFFLSESGLNAGNDLFIAPVNTSWPSLIQLWNISTTELSGALEGVESVLLLEDWDNEISYKMRIQYDGTMIDPQLGINFDFTYDALLQWEKSTGVLLNYKFGSQMEGTYNNTFSATFTMDLEIERDDIQDVLENKISSSPGFELYFIIIMGILLISLKRSIWK